MTYTGPPIFGPLTKQDHDMHEAIRAALLAAIREEFSKPPFRAVSLSNPPERRTSP